MYTSTVVGVLVPYCLHKFLQHTKPLSCVTAFTMSNASCRRDIAKLMCHALSAALRSSTACPQFGD